MSKLSLKIRELLNIKPRSAAPADLQAGDVWAESGSPSRLYFYNGNNSEEMTGNVSGPVGLTTDNALVRFDGTTGLAIQNSSVIVDDSNNMSGVVTLTATNVAATITTATQAQVNHNSLLNYVANEHINHTSVTLTAGAGLTGGGTIAANRTFAVDITGQTSKATPVAADEMLIGDSAASFAIKKATLTSIYNAIHGGTQSAVQLASVALADNQAAAADVFTLAVANNAIVVEYSLSRGTANKEVGHLYLTNDGTNASVSAASSTMGTLGVTFSADVSGGNVRLRYTSTSTGTAPTFKHANKYWAA